MEIKAFYQDRLLQQQKTPQICVNCNYITFTRYLNCPRCNSEKWRASTEERHIPM